MNKISYNHILSRAAQLIFILITIWWVILIWVFGGTNLYQNLVWAASYQALAWWGFIWGMFFSLKWGGYKSAMGRAISLFALGLFFQAFGQSIFSYFNIIKQVEIPYPSIADVGFFSSLICYILALIQLAKVSGAQVSLKSYRNKIQALLLPFALLIGSYVLFLNGYEFDWGQPIKIFLDFGYPLGDAIYVSIAILTLLLTRHILGGIMRNKVIFVLLALIAQYVADFNFLYQASKLTWVNGGYGDYLYAVAYFLTAYSVIRLADTSIFKSA